MWVTTFHSLRSWTEKNGVKAVNPVSVLSARKANSCFCLKLGMKAILDVELEESQYV